MDKLIITAAVSGSLTTRQNSPYVPYTPREIADEAVRAWEAGAAVVHIHVRESDGRASADPRLFAETIGYIKEKCDLIINTTTGGGQAQGISSEDRLAVVPACKPDLASLDVGAHILGRYDPEKRKWMPDKIVGHTFSELQHYAEVMRENGTKPEIEVSDVASIHAASLLLETGALDLPPQFGLVMGMAGQRMPATVRTLLFLVESLPPGSTWSAIGIGKNEFTLGAAAVSMGGHVRVGLEDNVFLSRGVLAKSNAELVEKMVRIACDMGREVASPSEAREILGLGVKH